MIMMLLRNKLLILLLFPILTAFNWGIVNNNILWDYYFKIKGIRINTKIQITEKLELALEIKPSYLGNPLSIRPEKLTDVNQYFLEGHFVYRF